jgi:hypothetical protein
MYDEIKKEVLKVLFARIDDGHVVDIIDIHMLIDDEFRSTKREMIQEILHVMKKSKDGDKVR